jgi:hypothetical protein
VESMQAVQICNELLGVLRSCLICPPDDHGRFANWVVLDAPMHTTSWNTDTLHASGAVGRARASAER